MFGKTLREFPDIEGFMCAKISLILMSTYSKG